MSSLLYHKTGIIMKKSSFYLRWAFARFSISAPHDQIEGITNKYPLDWIVEVVHIYAWMRYKGGWNQANWVNKLDIWGNRTKRTNPWFSKTPGFERCRAEIESTLGGNDTPDFVDEDYIASSSAPFEPQTMEEVRDHFGEDSPQFESMILANDLIVEGCNLQQFSLSRLGDRYEKLIDWLGWKDNTSEQDDKTHDLLVQALKKDWINENLLLWIQVHNLILTKFILSIKKYQQSEPPKIIIEQPIIEQPKEDPRPEEDETTCIIDGENLETLYYVRCKVPGCKLPLLGRVLSEDGDQILVWLIASVDDEDKFWMKRSLCKIIKEDLQTQRGNISKEQIDESISKLVGE